MAASRRRSSGFSEKPQEEIKSDAPEELVSEEIVTEEIETIAQEVEEPTPVAEEVVFSIPRLDPPPPPPAVKAPALAPRPVLPRRPQRNVPRFSRVK